MKLTVSTLSHVAPFVEDSMTTLPLKRSQWPNTNCASSSVKSSKAPDDGNILGPYPILTEPREVREILDQAVQLPLQQ